MCLFRQYSLCLTSTYTSTTTFAKDHFDKKSTILFYVYLHFRQTLGTCLQVWESVIDDYILGIYVVTSTNAERSKQVKKNKRMRFLHVGRNDLKFDLLQATFGHFERSREV